LCERKFLPDVENPTIGYGDAEKALIVTYKRKKKNIKCRVLFG